MICNPGEKARVNYNFNGTSETYETKNTPIQVTTESSVTIGSITKYGLTATVPDGWDSAIVYVCGTAYNNPATCTFIYIDYQVGTALKNQELTLIPQARSGCLDAHWMSIPAIGWGDFDTQWKGNNAAVIGLRENKLKCRLTITHADNSKFIVTGDCPLTYEVACGDSCPPGYCKCECDNYPGYCCLKTDDISYELRMARNDVRRIRGE